MSVDAAANWLSDRMARDNGSCEKHWYASREERDRLMENAAGEGRHLLAFCAEGGYGFFSVGCPSAQLEVGTLQNALDDMIKEKGIAIDYIHGEDVVYDLGMRPGNMGFTLPPMHKSALFRTVVFDGALPRKTFSMGEANEKRYYLECKRIK